MADDTTPSQPRDDRGGRPGGDRPPGNREPGGFRIRLSDNEMRAARAIQESFGLRSTVAALGFAIRTVAQLLEDGQLDELVARQRAQGSTRGDGPRADRDRGRGPRQERAPRIDPFARPSKPPVPAPEAAPAQEAAPGPVDMAEDVAPPPAASEEASSAEASTDDTASDSATD